MSLALSFFGFCTIWPAREFARSELPNLLAIRLSVARFVRTECKALAGDPVTRRIGYGKVILWQTEW